MFLRRMTRVHCVCAMKVSRSCVPLCSAHRPNANTWRRSRESAVGSTVLNQTIHRTDPSTRRGWFRPAMIQVSSKYHCPRQIVFAEIYLYCCEIEFVLKCSHRQTMLILWQYFLFSPGGMDTANLGLRLVASTVTSFLILALLLFMVHRLRQRRMLIMMRRKFP